MQNALSKIVCFLHRCGSCVGNVFGSILEQISADFGCFFGVGKGILERLVEVVCEGRVLSWILEFWGGGWEPKWEKVQFGTPRISYNKLNGGSGEGALAVLNSLILGLKHAWAPCGPADLLAAATAADHCF